MREVQDRGTDVITETVNGSSRRLGGRSSLDAQSKRAAQPHPSNEIGAGNSAQTSAGAPRGRTATCWSEPKYHLPSGTNSENADHTHGETRVLTVRGGEDPGFGAEPDPLSDLAATNQLGASVHSESSCASPLRRTATKRSKPIRMMPSGDPIQTADRPALETHGQHVRGGEDPEVSVMPEMGLDLAAPNEIGANGVSKPAGNMPRRRPGRPREPRNPDDGRRPSGTGNADQDGVENQSFKVRGGEDPGSAVQPCMAVDLAAPIGVEPDPAAEVVAQACAAIVALQRQRIFCIKTQSAADRRCEFFIAVNILGYSNELEEAVRKRIMKAAGSMRLAGEKLMKDDAGRSRMADDTRIIVAPTDDGRDHAGGETLKQPVPPVALPIIQMSAAARAYADTLRVATEKDMAKRVRSLPVYPWAKAVAGFGDLGLAIVIGEAGGPLTRFNTVSKLWKRMGLAVIDGERQQRKSGAELALLHGYRPSRRAEMWTLADPLFRHQWRKATEEGEAGTPAGPYGEVYAKRRARTAETHPEWTKAHSLQDARRVMFKALLADLWGEWRRLDTVTASPGT